MAETIGRIRKESEGMQLKGFIKFLEDVLAGKERKMFHNINIKLRLFAGMEQALLELLMDIDNAEEPEE